MAVAPVVSIRVLGVGCSECNASLIPALVRLNDNHFGVQFNDYKRVVKWHGKVISDCTEVMTGAGGWAIRLYKPVQLCTCGSDKPAMYKQRGDHFTVDDI